MDEDPERRRYYPEEDDAPLSQVVLEAVEAHEKSSLSADEFTLFERVNPRAIDMLFQESSDVSVSARFVLPNVTVSIWSDGGVEVRVTDADERRPGE